MVTNPIEVKIINLSLIVLPEIYRTSTYPFILSAMY